LFAAAHSSDTAAINELAAAGANVNARDPRRRPPAHVAAFASEEEALQILSNADVDLYPPERRANDVVTIAAVADDPEFMSLAIALGNDPGLMTSPYCGTALIAAAHLGHVEVVRHLIEAGARLDHINNLH
jgi:ankyrin repeat protein